MAARSVTGRDQRKTEIRVRWWRGFSISSTTATARSAYDRDSDPGSGTRSPAGPVPPGPGAVRGQPGRRGEDEPVDRGLRGAKPVQAGGVREGERAQFGRERRRVVQHHPPVLVQQVREEADDDEPGHAGRGHPGQQRVHGRDEEPLVELAELGQGLRPGGRRHGADRGVVAGQDRGHRGRVPDVARHDADTVRREAGVAGGVPHHRGDPVSPAPRLGGDGPSGAAARAEDGDVAHDLRTSIVVDSGGHGIRAGLGYRNETGASLGRVTTPLDPEMFDPMCPSSVLPFRIGDKWTGMVVRCLEQGPLRFGELRGPLRGVTSKVLSETLRAMERDGLIRRIAYPENSPRVEYDLTPLGRSLLPLLDAARAWSREHLPELLRARQAYDAD